MNDFDDDTIDQVNDQFNDDYDAAEKEFSIFVHHFFSKHIKKFIASQLYEMCTEVISATERQFI